MNRPPLLLATIHRARMLKHFARVQAFTREGFAGVLGNGNIVDRREHPSAIPIPENKLLGVPKPRPLPKA